MRKLAFVCLVLCVALFSTGCMDYSGVVESMMSQQEEDNKPRETFAPLTEPMYEDANALYKYYNSVKVGDMLDDVKEKYGDPLIETTENGEVYTWKMEDGYGFSSIFYDSGRMRAKVLYYDDIRQLGKLSGATGLKDITSISKNYTMEMVKALLGGRGMELMRMAADNSTNPEIKLLYLWIDEEGNFAQVLFSANKTVESVNYYLVEEEQA